MAFLDFLRARAPAVDLAWIDDFFREAGSHLFAREEDGVVILPPNQVYKANATGIAIVMHLLKGGRAAKIPGIDQADRAQQVAAFVSDLRALYLGEPAADGRAPYETVPYSFQYTSLPILGEIAVTYKCNNACVFCYAGCGTAGCTGAPRDVTGATEMSLAEVKRVIRIFRDDAKVPFFSFTGGEPLLRSDLEEMISFARVCGLQVNLITNGILASPERARSLQTTPACARPRSAWKARMPPPTTRSRPGPVPLRGPLPGTAASSRRECRCRPTRRCPHPTPRRWPACRCFLLSLGVTRFAMNLYLPSGGNSKQHGPAAGSVFPYKGDHRCSAGVVGGHDLLLVLADPPLSLQHDCARPGEQVLRRNGRPSLCLSSGTCCPARRIPSPWATC